jgi:glycosyltransferase involved in cell wall biosynthesis
LEKPLVTVVTATTGGSSLVECLRSVQNQNYPNIQHLVMIDGPERSVNAYKHIEDSGVISSDGYRLDVIDLPYSVGKDRWNGHRIYGSGCYIADGDFLLFLDDDNTIDNTHVSDCISLIEKGFHWTYSLRKIVDRNGDFLCNDDCESLGKWPSILHPEDYFIDVNCYFLPKLMAVNLSPIWHRKFREPGQPEVDRVLCAALREHFPNFACTNKYSVNYKVGNTGNSVQDSFFVRGNAEMLKRYNGDLPWKK